MGPPDEPIDRLIAELRQSVADERVLRAVASVPRERFVRRRLRPRAWENVALPIECEQTISQPLVVARMLELLELDGSERVLDVGTGSGYHAALLARLAARVLSIERHAPLSKAAGAILNDLGIGNVELFVGDGTIGLPEHAPFDAINVAAAAEGQVPQELVRQLAPGGRLVAPVAEDSERPQEQRLIVVVFDGERLTERRYEPVRFVPLVPADGEGSPPPRGGAR